MAYKTKSKSKRQYKKKSKKIYYGGVDPRLGLAQYAAKNALGSLSLDPTQTAKTAAFQAFNDKVPSDYKKLLDHPVIDKMGSRVMDSYLKERDPNNKPTLESNLQLILKLIAAEGNHLTDIFINNVSKELNIDLNQNADQIVSQLRAKITLIINILKSEQGQAFVMELEELFNQGLSIFKPIINKTLDEFNQTLEKELKVLVRIGNTAATEFPPFFLAEEFINFLTALITGLTAAAKIFPEVADALNKIDKFKQEVTNMQGKFNNLVNQDLRANLNPPLTGALPSNVPIRGGSIMKKLMKERKMLGGSIEKARADFLNPNLTLSQLIRPHRIKSRKRAYL